MIGNYPCTQLLELGFYDLIKGDSCITEKTFICLNLWSSSHTDDSVQQWFDLWQGGFDCATGSALWWREHGWLLAPLSRWQKGWWCHIHRTWLGKGNGHVQLLKELLLVFFFTLQSHVLISSTTFPPYSWNSITEKGKIWRDQEKSPGDVSLSLRKRAVFPQQQEIQRCAETR